MILNLKGPFNECNIKYQVVIIAKYGRYWCKHLKKSLTSLIEASYLDQEQKRILVSCLFSFEMFDINKINCSFAAVKAISSFTEKNVIQLPKEKRLCRADEDPGLDYFPLYSQSGCITECATRKMKENCGCRPFFVRCKCILSKNDFVYMFSY